MNQTTNLSDTDRRPIAARRLQPVERTAGWLIQHGASPNLISTLGMIAAIGAGLAFAYAGFHPWLWLVGALLVQVRLMANLLDGMVAIGRGIASSLGELFNEVPDRVSDTAVFAGLGVVAGRPALGLGVALAAMATAYIRAIGKAAGRPSDFCGPGAKQHRMAIVTVFAVSAAIAPARLADPVWEGLAKACDQDATVLRNRLDRDRARDDTREWVRNRRARAPGT